MHTRVKDSLLIPGIIDSDESSRSKKHGFYFDVFGGYRKFFGNHYLIGFELGIGRDSNSSNTTFKHGAALVKKRLKSKYKIMPALVFGKQLNDRWLIFTKLGVSLAQLEGTRIFNVNNIARKPEKFKKHKAGFLGSLGMEYAHNEKLSTVGSVTYEKFGALKCGYKPSTTLPGEKNAGSFKPSYVTAKIGLAYRF
jgi:OmpA-like transmembrane domain.